MGKCKTKAIQTDLGNIRHNQAYSKHFVNLAYSKSETCSEPWCIHNPGILKTLAYSEPKNYSDIYDVKTFTMNRFVKTVNGK